MKRLLYFKRDTRGFVCEVFLPIVVVIGGLSILLIDFIYSAPENPLTPGIFKSPLDTVFSGDYTKFPASTIEALSKEYDPEYFKAELYDASNNLSKFDDYNLEKENFDFRQGGYYMKDISENKKYRYLQESLSISKDSAPYFMNRMNEAIINFHSKKDVKI